jgi:hypothetical protein
LGKVPKQYGNLNSGVVEGRRAVQSYWNKLAQKRHLHRVGNVGGMVASACSGSAPNEMRSQAVLRVCTVAA